MRPGCLLPVLVVLALASCGPSPGDLRRAGLQSLIGRSETDAIRMLGVPSRTVQSGDTTFLQWDQQTRTVYPGVWGYGWGPPFYGGVPPEVVEHSCQTMIEVQGGKVITWSERGNGC